MYTCGVKAKKLFFSLQYRMPAGWMYTYRHRMDLMIIKHHEMAAFYCQTNKNKWKWSLMPFKKFSIHPTSQPPPVDVVVLSALFSFLVFTFLGNLKIAGMFSFILMGTLCIIHFVFTLTHFREVAFRVWCIFLYYIL